MAISLFEIWYYGAIFLFGFFPALAKLAADGVKQSIRYCIGVSALSGFYSFAVVSIAFGNPAADGFNHWAGIGCSIAVGLLGSKQEVILRTVLKKAGFDFGNKEESNE